MKKLSFKKRIFICIFVAALVPVMILAFFSYRIYTSEAEEKVRSGSLVMLNQASNRVDNVLDSVRSYYMEMGRQEAVEWLLSSQNQGYSDYVNLIRAADYLRGPVFLQEYLNGYVFIDGEQQKILSNKGIWDLQSIEGADAIDVLLHREEWSSVWWVNGMEKPILLSNNGKREMLLDSYMLIFYLTGYRDGESSYFITTFNMDGFRELAFQDLHDAQLVVLDRDRNVICSSSDALTETLAEACDSLLHEESDFIPVSPSEGSNWAAAAKYSDSTGLIYIIAYDRAIALEGAERIVGAAVGILSFTVMLALAVLSGQLIYRPINALGEKLGKRYEMEMQGDVLNYLESGIRFFADKSDSLEQQVSAQKKAIEASAFRRMLRGEMAEETIGDTLAGLGRTAADSYQLLFLSMIPADREFEGNAVSDVIYGAVADMISETLGEKLFLPPVSRENGIACILAGEDRSMEERLNCVRQEIAALLEKSFPEIKIRIGVSRKFHRLVQTRYALHESMEALKQNTEPAEGTKEANSIFYYEDFGLEQGGRNRYDLASEAEICKAVDRQDAEGACLAMNSFLDKLMMEKLSCEERNYSLTRLLVAILKVGMDAGIPMSDVLNNESVNIFSYLGAVHEDRDIRGFFSDQIIVPLVDKLEEFRSTTSDSILQNVMKLVREARGDITLSECAEKLNYHRSYIWKVLKLEKNMTFTDFVTAEKLELAKDMLKNTDMPVAAVAAELNYTNTQNFIRFFSKREGMSPGKYRESFAEKQKKGKGEQR